MSEKKNIAEENLYDLSNAVTDENSFLEFLCLLAADKEEENAIEARTPSSRWSAGAMGWENGTIESFLTAAQSWASSTINNTDLYKKPENTWTRAAQILHAGKFYE